MRPSNFAQLTAVGLFVLSLIALFPLSVRLANPFATLAYNPAVEARILLLWPDRIELRPIADLANFSPRSDNAGYSFLLPTDRLTWVTERLQSYATPTAGTSWRLRVKPLASGRQEITLELLGDGFYGVVYEASEKQVVPLKTRLAGPGFAFIVFGIDVIGSILLLLIVLRLKRLLRP
jgi:hypothetical protein